MQHLRLQCPRGHQLRYQHDTSLALSAGLPEVIEAHDVGVLQAFQHLCLLFEPLPFKLGELPVLEPETGALGGWSNGPWLPLSLLTGECKRCGGGGSRGSLGGIVSPSSDM